MLKAESFWKLNVFHMIITGLLCATLMGSFEIRSAAAENQSGKIFSEKFLPVGRHTKDNLIFKKSITLNKKQTRIAYVAKKKGKSYVAVNGKAGKLWDRIVVPTPIFSPSGERFAYICVDWKDAHLVVDGKVGPRFDKIWEVQFSPNSKHFAYLASNKKRKKEDAYLVINHKKGRKVLAINQMRFSPDSRHIAYIAMLSDGKWHLIVDNKKPGSGYAVMHSIVWSQDSKHLSYIAGTGAKMFVVLDGKQTKMEGEPVGMTVFSDDSTLFSVAAFNREEKKWRIFRNGKVQYDFPYVGEFKYSPDSRHYVFQGGVSSHEVRIIYDGKKSEVYSQCTLPNFSNDSHKWAYTARSDGDTFMVVNGIKQKTYSYIYPPVFSDDSKHMAYRVKYSDDMMGIVYDGRELPRYKNVGTPIFSFDGNHLAYVVRDQGQWFLIYDGKKGKRYDGLGLFSFSPDNKSFAFTAKRDDKWFVVVNGQEGELTFDQIVNGALIAFDTPKSFHLFTIKKVESGSEFSRLDVNIH